MYIKEIILDGFKSYATRTVVSGFDSAFNAITGLNGSGKSNILDSICFVLGITQLSQVRVSNLQGLVYKQGQAGVTKASVTIVFDNKDSKSSPVGYEQFSEITITRQVVIGGKNKYLINGHNAQASQVQNLFHSVQLNVNNPHFLIMQGRITKVLNMKPIEILGMIEEAAGTRMYETKKISAQKKMQQKQVKVDEINNLLTQEITPKLEKLRTQKQTYLKWTAGNTEHERLERFVVAYSYMQKMNLLNSSEQHLEQLQQKLEEHQIQTSSLNSQKATLIEMQQSLHSRKQQQLDTNLKQLTDQEMEASKQFVKANSQLESIQNGFNRDSTKIQTMQQRQTDATTILEGLQDKLAHAETVLLDKQKQIAEAQEAHEAAQRGIQGANAGMEGESTCTERLSKAKCAIETAASNIQQLQLKLEHAGKESKELTKTLETIGNEDKQLAEEYEGFLKMVKSMEETLANINYSDDEIDTLLKSATNDESELATLNDKIDHLTAKLAAFKFDYTKPSSNFDDSKVKGLVAKLVKVKDLKAATALEVVAGGKLFQVVVDDANTGKQLLQNGKLKKRVTIIPLDKVAARRVPDQKLKEASRLAKANDGFAKLAISFVGCDEQVKKAMYYVFGTSLICDTIETARKVTFAKDVRVRSVTLEGDSFDPQGTLSGGSRPSSGSILIRLNELVTLQATKEEITTRLAETKKKIDVMKANKAEYKDTEYKLESARTQLGIVEAKVKSTEYAQLLEKNEKLQVSMKQLTEEIHKERENKSQQQDKVQELEEEMKDADAAKDKLVAKATETLNKAKSSLQLAQKALQESSEARDLAKLEIDQFLNEQEDLQQNIDGYTQELSQTQTQISALTQDVDQKKQKHEELTAKLTAKKKEVSSVLKELASIAESLAGLDTKIQQSELNVKKTDAKLKRFNQDEKEAKKSVEHMLKKYPWIRSEQQFFGKPHTDYDFEGKDVEEAEKRLQEIQVDQDKLAQQINKKVMGMIEKAEKEYNDLQKKRAIIEKDRETIQRVIQGLDEKKNQALRTTYAKVNKDFGSIFSTLLTGANAKLEPPQGGTVLDGLEVKVAFGQTWKESLTELSGGQRSLIALSLILALLLFKPAPMYILDEVDAALDLSHTQNIGQMLRTHFAHSQFIVVSLKEGMFNNANVIFRTKFVDGVSTVRRTLGGGLDKENNDAEEAPRGKKVNRRSKASTMETVN